MHYICIYTFPLSVDSENAASFTRSFVTTVVLGDDMIPRYVCIDMQVYPYYMHVFLEVHTVCVALEYIYVCQLLTLQYIQPKSR